MGIKPILVSADFITSPTAAPPQEFLVTYFFTNVLLRHTFSMPKKNNNVLEFPTNWKDSSEIARLENFRKVTIQQSTCLFSQLFWTGQLYLNKAKMIPWNDILPYPYFVFLNFIIHTSYWSNKRLYYCTQYFVKPIILLRSIKNLISTDVLIFIHSTKKSKRKSSRAFRNCTHIKRSWKNLQIRKI